MVELVCYATCQIHVIFPRLNFYLSFILYKVGTCLIIYSFLSHCYVGCRWYMNSWTMLGVKEIFYSNQWGPNIKLENGIGLFFVF
jgi:hypothetical protein